MKKLKYMFMLAMLILLGLLVYQNLAFFSSKHSLHLNLGFYEGSTPELANGAIIAIFVGVSVLIMMMFYFASRYQSYRAKKMIQKLQTGVAEGAETITKLNQEVEMLKSGCSEDPISETPENTPENTLDAKDRQVDEPALETNPTTQR